MTDNKLKLSATEISRLRIKHRLAKKRDVARGSSDLVVHFRTSKSSKRPTIFDGLLSPDCPAWPDQPFSSPSPCRFAITSGQRMKIIVVNIVENEITPCKNYEITTHKAIKIADDIFSSNCGLFKCQSFQKNS